MIIAISIIVGLVWIFLGILGFCLYRTYGREYIESDLLMVAIFFGAVTLVCIVLAIGYEKLEEWICKRW